MERNTFVLLSKNEANMSERYNKQGRSNMILANSTKIPHTNNTLILQRNDCQVGKHIYVYFTDIRVASQRQDLQKQF